jgi:hypothetical protein
MTKARAKTKTKAKTKAKAKAIRMPGKERPAASQSRIQRPPTTEPHLRNAGINTKPSAGQPAGQIAEGLDYRFAYSAGGLLAFNVVTAISYPATDSRVLQTCAFVAGGPSA